MRLRRSFYDESETALPVIYITAEAKKRLDLYIQSAHGEISGLGKVIQVGNDFLVTEVYLFKQECTDISTELSQEAIAGFLFEAIKEGRDSSELKLWWHSHADMPAFFSTMDHDTASSFQNGWMISIVGNKAGQYQCLLDVFEPLRLTLPSLELQVRLDVDEQLRAEIEAEVREKVKQKRRGTNPYYTILDLDGVEDSEEVPLLLDEGQNPRVRSNKE